MTNSPLKLIIYGIAINHRIGLKQLKLSLLLARSQEIQNFLIWSIAIHCHSKLSIAESVNIYDKYQIIKFLPNKMTVIDVCN